jgi:flagellar assembly factor FliW
MNTLELIEPKTHTANGQKHQSPKNVICLPFGLLGFEDVKNYALLANPAEAPLMWLQMLEGAKQSFRVVPASVVLPEYQPDISDQDVEFLGLTGPADAVVFNIVTLREGRATVNLKGPVVINRHSMVGKQVIPNNAGRFDPQHVLSTAKPAPNGKPAAPAAPPNPPMRPSINLEETILAWQVQNNPNLRGVTAIPPGNYDSPLLDIKALQVNDEHFPNDGPECWEHIRLRATEQRRYYQELLENYPVLSFPPHKAPDYRFFWDNDWFALMDAFTLSGIIQKEKPSRIIEVGSGFSSAVMLDTLDRMPSGSVKAKLTYIEPFPERLGHLLTASDREKANLIVKPVQDVPLSVFDELQANDILFIDSSHVGKVGSDVTFILLRVLPRLQPGVLIHFHDVCYPHSYPIKWLRRGIAWNESLFLRAFLVCNKDFEIFAFNSHAAYSHPELFKERFPQFLANSGGSIWMRKLG